MKMRVRLVGPFLFAFVFISAIMFGMGLGVTVATLNITEDINAKLRSQGAQILMLREDIRVVAHNSKLSNLLGRVRIQSRLQEFQGREIAKVPAK